MALSLSLNSQNLEYQIGGSLPTANNITIYFGGILANQYPGYQNVKMKCIINSGQNEWVNITGISVGENNEIDITHPSATVGINLFNLQNLDDGNYYAEITFLVTGDNNGPSYILDEITHGIYLHVSPAITLSTDKFIYEITYVKSNNTFSGQTLISLLNNASSQNCSIELSQSLNYFAIQDASFNTSTNIIAGSQLASLANVNASPLAIPAVLKDASGTVVYNFTLKIILLDNDNITASEESFSFELVKSKSETKTAKFNISNPSGKSFTITAPAFLAITPNSGNSSIEVTVQTVNSSTLNLGTYTGNIVITYDTTKTVVIPISLSVINFFRSELSSDFNFCLDKKLMKFYKIDSTGTFVRANLSITFKTPASTKTVERTHAIPYFEGRADMDLGAMLQTYFMKYVKNILTEIPKNKIFSQKVWYYPAVITGTVEELDANYQVKNSETLTPIKFFAGKKPSGYPLLTNNLVRRRSKDSKVIFSFISGVTDINDFGADFTSFDIVPEKVATVLKTETADNLFTWPDVKIFSIGANPVKIYTLKNNNQTVNISFYNSNLVPDWLTITGDYKISDNYNHVISRNVIAGNEEKFDSDKTKNLTIDSGFILKSELNILSELAESKLLYLEIAGKNYKGILTTNKIDKEDSTEELIARSLEFLIVEV